MFKLFHRKLNKKGFTLAELLVVIAILAILIAIAVPVFTNMVAEANLRVNQANVHSVRSAAVAHILTNLGMPDDSPKTIKDYPRLLNSQIGTEGAGWVATAKVDNNGNISDLNVYVLDPTEMQSVCEGISVADTTNRQFFKKNTATFYPLSTDLESKFATVKPSMGVAKVAASSGGSGGGAADPGDPTKVYYVQAVVTDLDPRAEATTPAAGGGSGG